MTAPPSLRAATAKSFLRRRPASSVLAAAAGAAVLIERTASLRDARPLEEAVPSDRFDPRAVSEYWSNRPVSVACRLGTVVCGLGPVAGDYLAAYQIRPRLAPLLGRSGGDGNKDEDEELRRQTALARKLRSALTNLGPTFVKVGQQLSIRPDVVPPAVLHELQRLCDAVPPFDDKIAMGVLREELARAASKERKRRRREDGHDENEELAIKGDINDRPSDNLEEEQEDASNSNNILLEVFESTPRLVASASLGQVYRARLRSTDQDVAVKVQRPDILETVSLDLFLLLSYGRLVDKVCSVLTNQVPYHESFLTDFAAGAYMELNYENEGSNQEYFRSELRKRKGTKDRVVVPRVHGEHTTRRVLVSEWIDGTPLARSSPEQIRRLIPVGVELFLTQLLDIGRFHADPHPGNLYVTKSKEDGTTPVLCLLDFGLVAKVSQDERESMTRAIVNLLRGDYDALISTDAKSLGFLPPDADVTDLRPVLETILRRGLLESGSDMNDRRRNLMAISDELNEVFFRYPFSVPPFFALVTRGLGLLEGIALAGDPDFDIFRASYPYATRRAVEAFGSVAGSDAWRLPRWVCNVAGR